MAIELTNVTAVQRAQVAINIETPAEPCGMLEAINLNFNDKGAALGQTIVVPVVTPHASSAITPSNVPSTGTAAAPVNVQLKITDSYEQSRSFNTEELKLLEDVEVKEDVLRQWMLQAQRTMRNEMDAKAAAATIIGASRAIGTPGSLPFATDLNALTSARKILRKNGAPLSDIQIVTNVDAYTNMLNQNIIQKAQEAGSDQERRTGVIRGQFGTAAIRESNNIADFAVGAGTGYVLDGNHAKGATAIKVKSGTVNTTGIKLGDVIKFAGDPNNMYCVGTQPGTTTDYVTQAALTATSGYIYIGNPGLQKALPDGTALTIQGQSATSPVEGITGFSPSFAFERFAVVGLLRPPIQPAPNNFYNTLTVVKDKFGYSYLFAEANQNFQVSWFLWALSGFAVTQREFVVPIIGN